MNTPAVLAPLISRVHTSYCWVRKPGELPSRWATLIDDALIAGHLDSRYSIGATPISPGTSVTRLALLDLDSHKGEVSWLTMQGIALELIEALAENHQHAIPFRSSGGSGIHLYLLWDKPQDAYTVREELRIALAKCGLTSGTGGIAKQQVEIFPKQDKVPADGFGSMFILPLSGKSRALLDGALDDTVPGNIQWRVSDALTTREKPINDRVANSHATTEHPILVGALAAIPNDGAGLDYDAWFKVVCAIHSATSGGDAGLAMAHSFSARAGKYDSAFLDERVWPYITERDDGYTVQSIFNMASANGWIDPAVQSAFDVVPNAPIEAEASTVTPARFRALTVAEFTAGVTPPWIIKDIIPQAALAVIFGESTSGKTFFTLDVLCAVARGGTWRGKRITQGRGIYICAEGVSGFRNRVRAYTAHHLNNDYAALDIRVIADAPNFGESDDIKAVIAEVKRVGPVAVVVVDTFAQVMPGANENSGEDVGRAIYHCQQIHRVTGALVVLVHHSGKDASKGARGWSGLRAAADAEIEITRCDNDRVATITKLKDGEDGLTFGFKLQTVHLAPDADGDMVTSCVVDYTDANTQVAKIRKPGAKQQHVIDTAKARQDRGEDLTAYEITQEAIKSLPTIVGVKNNNKANVERAVRELFENGWFVAGADGRTFTILGYEPFV